MCHLAALCKCLCLSCCCLVLHRFSATCFPTSAIACSSASAVLKHAKDYSEYAVELNMRALGAEHVFMLARLCGGSRHCEYCFILPRLNCISPCFFFATNEPGRPKLRNIKVNSSRSSSPAQGGVGVAALRLAGWLLCGQLKAWSK